MVLKIAFDIGGVLSKYPDQFRALINKLQQPSPNLMQPPGVELHVISDMHDVNKMHYMLVNNGMFIDKNKVHSANYAEHGEYCKTHLCKQLGIDILIDDFIGYLAEGDFIRMLVMPDAKQPYYADSWKTDGSEGDFGRRRKKI